MTLTLVIGNKNYSSWLLRPWLAMKQFGLEFHEICIPLYNQESSAKIRQYSPSGKVPVLLHDTQTVWDSLAICEYLAEEFPHMHWWSKDKAAKAFAILPLEKYLCCCTILKLCGTLSLFANT